MATVGTHGLKRVPDERLEAGLREALGRERAAAAEVVEHLVEVDRRRLHAERGYATLWKYAVSELGMSEDQAARRVKAVDAVKAAPRAFELLRAGELTMSVLAEIAVALRAGVEHGLVDVDQLLDFARGRSVREVRRFVAEALVEPGPLDRIRERPATEVVERGRRMGTYPRAGGAYEVTFTASEDFVRKLERARELLGHVVVDGDFEDVLGRGLDLLVEKLERRREGKLAEKRPGTGPARATGSDPVVRPATSRRGEEGSAEPATSRRAEGPSSPEPATSRRGEEGSAEPATSRRAEGPPSPEPATSLRAEETPAGDGGASSRKAPSCRKAIPRAVRREVWERDGGRCTYVSSSTGRICGARSGLEIDHVVPKALGGADSASNTRIRCRTHNRARAEDETGDLRFRRS